ncbi:MAG: hypothetical protein ACOC5D_06055 [Thermoplasmatota archaeon]
MEETDRIEKKLESLMKSLEEGVEEDPEAHERLLKLGEEILDKSKVSKKAVDEFLKERKSL